MSGPAPVISDQEHRRALHPGWEARGAKHGQARSLGAAPGGTPQSQGRRDQGHAPAQVLGRGCGRRTVLEFEQALLLTASTAIRLGILARAARKRALGAIRRAQATRQRQPRGQEQQQPGEDQQGMSGHQENPRPPRAKAQAGGIPVPGTDPRGRRPIPAGARLLAWRARERP
jgi:hypothetical protein